MSLIVGSVVAQDVRVVAPIGIGAIGQRQSSDEDIGVPVQMFENPNLDRYLRRAQSFLEQANYVAAIEVLQDVIQGRTVEFLGSSEDHPPADPNADPSGNATTGSTAAEKDNKNDKTKSPAELDAANSVFSEDGRLYRPVRRLCHELLAEMPAMGVELYRALHEVSARELFDAAMADGSVPDLEKVINRYFITLPAGKAMVVLADRFMHEGRYRAAVQVLRDLIEVYPKNNLRRIGANQVWCKFKIALCLRMAGEPAVAQQAVREIAAEHPDESLRILGELQTVKNLPDMAIFADEVIAMVESAMADGRVSWLTEGGAETATLVPLWQYRYIDPRPYRNPKSAQRSNNNFIMWNEGSRTTSMPHANRYGPASWMLFVPGETPQDPPRALLMDHYRLRVADARTGLLIRDGDGVDAPPKPRDGHPRVRVAASDHALMRPIEDEARRYVVLGHSRNTSASVQTLKSSELVAYDRKTMKRVWSSAQWLDGDDGMRDVTFTAAPSVFGERLLLPARRRDGYSLECLDRSTGRPLWHTMLHSGGTHFYKAPGSPVVVSGGTAFVVTNAGCLAAVDAFAGDLRWIRRYEREDPLRPRVRPRGANRGRQTRYGIQFVQGEITGFLPNDLIVKNGLVIIAACDSGMLLALDEATGKSVWMVDGTSRYAPYGKLRTIVGATPTDLFATSDKALVCIGLRGGLIKWSREIPTISGPKNVGRGRGTIVFDTVLLPGDREVYAFDAKGVQPMRRIRLPAFGVSQEPLKPPFNIVASGPWLGIGFQGGVEVFSSKAALRKLATETTDPWQAAGLRVSAGDVDDAEKILFDWLTTSQPTAKQRRKGCRKLLSLVRQRALQLAEDNKLSAAMSAFDRIGSLCSERTIRMGWHLARVEVCEAGGDMRAHENEQQGLYDFMEGKG